MATRQEAVRFSLIDNVTKGLVQIQKSVTGVGASLVKLNAAAQLAATGIQAVSSVGNAFNGLIKGASDAQFQLAGLQAALGATPEELAKLDAEAKRVSETLGLFTKAEVLDALGGLGKAGLSAADAMKALNPVLNLATAGQVDLQFATDLTVNSLTQFGLSIDKANELANGLVTAANASTTDVNKLGLALSYAATQARAANNDLETTLEVLGGLAQVGLQGERAGTALRLVFAELSNDSSKFSKALREGYGITTTNLIEVVEQLRVSADGGKRALLALGIEARPAIQGLVNLSAPELDKLRQEIDLTGSSAEDATAKLSATFEAARGRIVNILTNLRNELSAPILKPFGDALESLAKRVSEFAKTDDFQLLKEAITDFATEAGVQVENLIQEFDFTEASENARRLFANLQASLEDFKANASIAIGALKKVLEGLNVAVAAFEVYFNGVAVIAANFSKIAVNAALAIAKVTGASKEAIEELEFLRDTLKEIGNERFEKLGASTDRLVRSFGNLFGATERSGRSFDALSESAQTAAEQYDELLKSIGGARTAEKLDEIATSFVRLAAKTELSADQVAKFEAALANASQQFGKVSTEAVAASPAVEKVGEAFRLTGENAKTLEDGAVVFAKIGDGATLAADDTKRLAQAFRDANSAGQFEGALDQFERLKASGRLTAEQIAEIEKAAQEAGKKFEEAGDKGEDAFERVGDAAEDAKDSVEQLGDAAENQASSLEDVFKKLRDAQERSAQLNEEIGKQIESQRQRSNDLLEKEIELLDRKLNMSREELAIADQLRQRYKLADQERIDRLAQLIARQREMNREKEEELRITRETTSAAAPERPGSPGTSGAGRRANGGAGEVPGDESQSAPLSARALARLLAPELARLQARGG